MKNMNPIEKIGYLFVFVLLMIGAPLPIILGGFLNVPFGGEVVFTAALAWAGYELWSGAGAASEPASVAEAAA